MGNIHLPFSTINENQVGKRHFAAQSSFITSGQDFLHRGKIIRALNALDSVFSVVLPGSVIPFPTDHGCHGLIPGKM